MVLDRVAKHAGSFAVDDRDLMDAREDARIDETIDLDQCLFHVHPAKIDLRQSARTGVSGAASAGDRSGADASAAAGRGIERFFTGGLAVDLDLGLVEQPKVADRHAGLQNAGLNQHHPVFVDGLLRPFPPYRCRRSERHRPV